MTVIGDAGTDTATPGRAFHCAGEKAADADDNFDGVRSNGTMVVVVVVEEVVVLAVPPLLCCCWWW